MKKKFSNFRQTTFSLSVLIIILGAILIPLNVNAISVVSSIPFENPLGLAWEGNYLWVSCGTGANGKICKINPTNGEIILFFNRYAHGLTWDGNYLWCVSYDEIHKLDPTNGNIITTIPSPPDSNLHGLAYDGEYLWVADSYETNKIFQIDPSDGAILNSFYNIYSDGGAWGLTWDGERLWNSHPQGHGTGLIHSINPQNGEILSTDPWPGIYPNGLAWDGSYLWGADYKLNRIYKLDVTAQDDPTIITLDYFTATEQYNNIILEWETLSELDNTGFNLWRSESKIGKYIKINPKIIEAVGGATLKAEYAYSDDTAKPGVIYNYKLEDIDTHGAKIFHDPVSATIPTTKQSSLPYYWSYYLTMLNFGLWTNF